LDLIKQHMLGLVVDVIHGRQEVVGIDRPTESLVIEVDVPRSSESLHKMSREK
jgi:hypothetical protein